MQVISVRTLDFAIENTHQNERATPYSDNYRKT